MAKNIADTAPAGSGPAPAVPETSVLVFAWIGIVIAGGASVTFNIHHDTSWLHDALAVVAGLTPPSLAAVLAHVASAFKNLALKIAVFVVCAGAMAVSAIGTTKTLEPGYGFFGGLGFSFVADSASMLCLWGLIEIYTARAKYGKWLAAQDAGIRNPAQNQPASDSRQLVLEPAAGTAGADPAPAPGVVPGTVAVPSEPAAGTSVAAPAAVPAEAAGRARPRAEEKTPAAAAGETGEERAVVVAEIAARPRPLEDTVAQQMRALDILAEFASRTGRRMNNAELGKALGISKAEACSIRQAVAEREAA